MEIKCNICGTINDGSTNFCKGCFQKLDIELKPDNIVKEEQLVVPLEEEKENVAPWIKEEPLEEAIEDDNTIIDNPVEEKEISWDIPDNDGNVIVSDNEQNEYITPSDDEVLSEDNKEELEINKEEVPELNKEDEIKTLEENIPLTAPEVIEEWNDEATELVNEDNNQVETKKQHFILKFSLIYIFSTVILFGILFLTSKYLNNIFDETTSLLVEFILYRVINLVTLLVAAKITFSKDVPDVNSLNKITLKILIFIAIPFTLVQLFILGFVKETTVLMFIIALILSLITLALFFNFIRIIINRKLENKTDDKLVFIYGIISIIIIFILFGVGVFVKNKNIYMPKITFLHNIFYPEEQNPELIQNFIYEVEKTMLKNQTIYEDYKVPSMITETSYATYENKIPDQMELTINENGAVVSGTIVYRGITYTYNNGEIKAK